MEQNLNPPITSKENTDFTPISTERTIEAIDFEIERINKENQRPGWTPWAIYGVVAFIIWTFFDILEKEIPSAL